MLKLNLGCGKQHKPKSKGWINIDISSEVSPDLLLNPAQEKLPYKDNSIDEIHAGCMIEQVGPNKEFIFLMNNIWRVLKPGCNFNGYVPSSALSVLYLDPMDRRFFQEASFDYFDVNKHQYQEFGKNYGLKPWQDIQVRTNENGIIFFEMKPAK